MPAPTPPPFVNKVRLGHYCIPADDNHRCLTALVVKGGTGLVNLAVFEEDGSTHPQTGVSVAGPRSDSASFHLSGECPWKR
jgi:hypothetical protein